ncbi:MAG: META domain-containing protein [Cyclobacteriaceae bacterium]
MNDFRKIFPILFLSLIMLSCNSEPIELSDHEWRVIDLSGAGTSKEKLRNLTLTFQEDQKISGFAGCNDYRGGATYNREQIKFSTLYTDKENCEDINLEKTYLSNLENSSNYTYAADKLVLFDDSGNILVEMEKK